MEELIVNFAPTGMIPTKEMNPNVPVVSRDVVDRIEKMEAPDDRTLIVTWKEPYAYYDQGHNFLPKHILGPIYEREKDMQEMKEFNEGDYNLFPLGNGPYMMTSKDDWKKGAFITVTKNPHFYGPQGYFKQITYKKTAALESDFVSGNINLVGAVSIIFYTPVSNIFYGRENKEIRS